MSQRARPEPRGQVRGPHKVWARLDAGGARGQAGSCDWQVGGMPTGGSTRPSMQGLGACPAALHCVVCRACSPPQATPPRSPSPGTPTPGSLCSLHPTHTATSPAALPPPPTPPHPTPPHPTTHPPTHPPTPPQGRRGAPRHPDPIPPHQEQPCADRRAGRGQDRGGRGPGAAHRRGRRARQPAGGASVGEGQGCWEHGWRGPERALRVQLWVGGRLQGCWEGRAVEHETPTEHEHLWSSSDASGQQV